MSPEYQGVFQLLKEVTFRRILAFYCSRKWDYFPHSSWSLRSAAFRVQCVETIVNEVQQCFAKSIES